MSLTKLSFSRRYWPKISRRGDALFQSLTEDEWNAFSVQVAESVIQSKPHMWIDSKTRRIDVVCGFWDVGGDTLAASVSIEALISAHIQDYSKPLISEPQVECLRDECHRLLRLAAKIERIAKVGLATADAAKPTMTAEDVEKKRAARMQGAPTGSASNDNTR